MSIATYLIKIQNWKRSWFRENWSSHYLFKLL